MEGFKHNPDFDLDYKLCIYSGILNKIKFEMEYGTDDKTEELTYLVDRYSEEELLSADYLKEELERYISAVKERGTTE